MSWKCDRQRERMVYRARMRRIMQRMRRRRDKFSGIRCFVPFQIKPAERPFVSQEGTPGFVKPRAVKSMPRHSLCLMLPVVFDFDEDYNSAAIVVGIFRRALIKQCRIGYIDFSKMRKISPACLMVFSCYADLWKDHQPQVTPWTHTWRPEIIAACLQIGFFDALGFEKKNIPAQSADGPIRYMGLRKYSMDSPLKDIGEESKTIREEIEKFGSSCMTVGIRSRHNLI